jgi:tetratricopeptide (TPR) repeat protein
VTIGKFFANVSVMIRCALFVLAVFLGFSVRAVPAETNRVSLVQQRWFETRTAHFNIYSCVASPELYKLAGQLEQFCEAFSLLAGNQAIASPPIVVVAFPSHEAMKPFLPLYKDQPGNFAGFFIRASDENLIVLSLPESDSPFGEMEVIFHEYTHLLFRHNDEVWPLWLVEGMAEVYSTFKTTGLNARIGGPLPEHLQILRQEPLWPLAKLFAVTRDSPQYNEREHQGMFYAESWLLTQFLMNGDNAVYRGRFGQFTKLLRDGQLPEQAFTNALQTTLPAVEKELRRYLAAGKFVPIPLTLSKNISSAKTVSTRALLPVETYFRLGDELLRVERFDVAEKYFSEALRLAPKSPLPYEGLGLLAAEREKHSEAAGFLQEALDRDSTSFLAYFACAREKYRLTADAKEQYKPVQNAAAAEIRADLRKSLTLMPSFGPAHELLGFFEMVQGNDLKLAQKELAFAIQLEPENVSYLFSLAQVQLRDRDPDAARRTLKPLLRPTVDAKLRGHAEDLIRRIEREYPAR